MLVPGKLNIAIQRLLKSYPLHAALVSRWRIAESEKTPTFGVRFTGDLQIELFYNPTFLDEIALTEAVGVLIHELNHVILGHLVMNPKDFKHPDLLVIAQEVTVNEFVGEPLPGSPILLKDFPCLKPDQSTLERYEVLVSAKPDLSDSLGVGPTDGNGGGQIPWDDHRQWQAEQTAALKKQIIDSDLAEAFGSLSEKDKAKITPELKKAIEQGEASQRGVGAGDSEEDIDESAHRRVRSWTALNRIVGKALAVTPSYHHPPRRLPHLVGILPGKRRTPTKPKILAAIDTSGSMTCGDLAFISAELQYLSRLHELTVVECDEEIHRVYPYQGPIRSVVGRGGTSFLPVFEKNFLKAQRPDVVIYFTDGNGVAPATAPSVPTIWVLYAGYCPAQWGQIVRVSVPNR